MTRRMCVKSFAISFAIKPALVASLSILDFHIRENAMNFYDWSRMFPNFKIFRDLTNFRKIWKTRVPPASPLPYLVYKGMSHTFDILQISFFKILCFFEVLSLWVFSVEVFRIFRFFQFLEFFKFLKKKIALF